MLISFAIALYFILLVVVDTETVKKWCPPPNFDLVRAKHRANFSSIISEIHGQVYNHEVVDINGDWHNFYDGDKVARFLYHHIGVMGFGKVHLVVVYNSTAFPVIPPTVEEIYPASKHCVVDWFNLGTLELWHTPYFEPKDKWPLHDGKPDNNLDLYKTVRGYNPIYASKLSLEPYQCSHCLMLLSSDQEIHEVGCSDGH